jgi:hypothetical protein
MSSTEFYVGVDEKIGDHGGKRKRSVIYTTSYLKLAQQRCIHTTVVRVFSTQARMTSWPEEESLLWQGNVAHNLLVYDGIRGSDQRREHLWTGHCTRRQDPECDTRRILTVLIQFL